MFILRNRFQTWCTFHACDIVPTVNHANCLDQEPVRHTYGNLTYGIRLLLNPPFHLQPFIRTESVHGGKLRQACLNYSLTLWPLSCIDTDRHNCARTLLTAPLYWIMWVWNLNCGACVRAVFVFRASPINCRGAQSCLAQAEAQRYTRNPPTTPINAGLRCPDCKPAPVN